MVFLGIRITATISFYDIIIRYQRTLVKGQPGKAQFPVTEKGRLIPGAGYGIVSV
jgi:hypothetical protein